MNFYNLLCKQTSHLAFGAGDREQYYVITTKMSLARLKHDMKISGLFGQQSALNALLQVRSENNACLIFDIFVLLNGL